MVMVARLMHPSKTPPPSEVTDSGSVIDVRLQLHLAEARIPIEGRPSGRVIVVNLLQFSKALSPSKVTIIVTVSCDGVGKNSSDEVDASVECTCNRGGQHNPTSSCSFLEARSKCEGRCLHRAEHYTL
jgi:hypothetical protein